jgi:hypothetical protein
MVFIIYMWMGTCYVVNCGWTRIFVLLDIRAVSKKRKKNSMRSIKMSDRKHLSK